MVLPPASKPRARARGRPQGRQVRSPQRVGVLDSRQLTERVSWTPPTIVGQTLYLRDRKDILAVDLSPGAYPEEE